MHDVILVAAMSDGHWRPGIGDPTPIGWFTVAAYFAAAIACGRAWRLDRRADQAGANTSPTFWLILTGLIGFLGVNKQLDLQSLLTDVARTLAKSQNWYAQRREVQLLFIAAVGVAALVALAAFAWIARKEWKRNITALAGVVLLLAFVVIRAASFHHVDAFIQTRLAGVKWNAILELGGIGLVALGAALAMRTDHGRRTAPRPDAPGRDDSMGPRRYGIPGVGPAAPASSRDRNRSA
ncbi:hypothetical protein [Paludisphaera borealis]|uniref:Uncharacterized protein n=1 Tax=Paludisphaera borealis TaxID=1387353 RepID=A0A1U7CKU4_9BACT|nr:hypothetical protein [Paludisphaera borealis]APW59560.1 hypothetical protein BSF38_00986 [Paludisphaera borealis]